MSDEQPALSEGSIRRRARRRLHHATVFIVAVEEERGGWLTSGAVAEAVVVLMCTIGAQALAALAAEGHALLDAPVSGGVARAETGELLVMAGGPTELFERVRPVLDAVGSTVVHCGERAGV